MATAPLTCPSLDAIEKIALGGDADGLQAHFEGCAACRATLDRIRADNDFLTSFAVGDALPAAAVEPPRAISI